MAVLKGLQRFNRRIGVGSLGIIVIRYAINRSNVFNAVLNAAEVTQHISHIADAHTGEKAAGNGCQHVFFVVTAKQMQLADIADSFLLAVPADDKITILHIDALLQFFLTAEVTQAAFSFRTPGTHDRIIVIKHRNLRLTLLTENIFLRLAVGLHRMMALQMIRSQVQHYCDIRAEAADFFQLKAGKLGSKPTILRQALYLLRQCQTDVAAYCRRHRQTLEHLTHDSSGSCFAVSTGDGSNVTAIQPVAKLNLTDDLQSALLCEQHICVIAGNTRRKHQHPCNIKQAFKCSLTDGQPTVNALQKLQQLRL